MRAALLFLISLTLTPAWAQQSIPKPADFLRHELGSQFSYHHQVVAYYKAVAAASDKVQIQPYGYTNEGRELMVAFVSSEENMANLENIRQDNLKSTGLLAGEKGDNQKPIVWLSYNIHGNESVSSEASMLTLYQLVTSDTANWLEQAIIVMDPCVNPDGRDRYTNWYRQAVNKVPNAQSDSWEHHEPWPGGRFNHYLFDLNRDWCWQTQIESQQRAILYHQWMPHVHVDFHEMGANSPYFFGPAAKPYHEVITPWQRDFQVLTGKNHASYFNRNGWLFFTKEIFDLFYPSYGDTWPTYQGAIGFTYEQGGGGSAGVRIKLNTGDTLSLDDRIAHHHTTGLSTIETAVRNQERLLTEFNQYFESSTSNPPGPYKAYVIKENNDPDRVQALLTLLDRNQIRYQYPTSGTASYKGFAYREQKEKTFKVGSGDIVVSAYQPQANLVKVLFEPEATLEDSLTYDLTAWSLPYAYNLEAYATTSQIGLTDKAVAFDFEENVASGDKPYGYLAKWTDLKDARFLSALINAKIKVRYTVEAFTLDKKEYPRGTLLIVRTDNPKANFEAKLFEIANAHKVRLTSAQTGFVDEGKDFGSGKVNFIKAPKIALVSGKGVSPSSFGELWHYFEQDLAYPVTVLNTEYLKSVDLSKYDVLILGQGSYSDYSKKILAYAEAGGKVIAMESAIRLFASSPKKAGKEGENAKAAAPTKLAAAVAARKKAEAKKKAEAEKKKQPDDMLKRYENRDRERISTIAPGSIYKVYLDDSHPLSFGVGKEVFLIKRNQTPYPYLPEGSWNIGVIKDKEGVSGFTGAKLEARLENTLAIGMEAKGKGSIIYFVDSPNFRQFWHGGKLLLSNAVFF